MQSLPASLRGILPLAAFAAAWTAAAAEPQSAADVATPAERPTMRQLDAARAASAVPTPQEITTSRPELRRRFRGPLSRAGSFAGAGHAAELLLSAAASEPDRTLRWLMIDEARRLGEAAGQAVIVARAIAAASAAYDFDAVEAELRSLKQIPLRGLDATRAAGVAVAAERVAVRAAADDRPDKTIAAEMLASRAWQRAGDVAAARRAAERHDAAVAAESPAAP